MFVSRRSNHLVTSPSSTTMFTPGSSQSLILEVREAGSVGTDGAASRSSATPPSETTSEPPPLSAGAGSVAVPLPRL